MRDGYTSDGYTNWIQIDTDLEGNFNGSSSILVRHKSNTRFHIYMSKSAIERMLMLFAASVPG